MAMLMRAAGCGENVNRLAQCILECRHQEDNITNMVRSSGSTVTLQPMTYSAKRHNTKMGTKALP